MQRQFNLTLEALSEKPGNLPGSKLEGNGFVLERRENVVFEGDRVKSIGSLLYVSGERAPFRGVSVEIRPGSTPTQFLATVSGYEGANEKGVYEAMQHMIAGSTTGYRLRHY